MMGNNKSSLNILGWGVITYLILCALPLLLVWSIVFWLMDGFQVLFAWVIALIGLAVFVWYTGGPLYEMIMSHNSSKEYQRAVWTCYLIVYGIILAALTGMIWSVLAWTILITALIIILLVWLLPG